MFEQILENFQEDLAQDSTLYDGDSIHLLKKSEEKGAEPSESVVMIPIQFGIRIKKSSKKESFN